MHGSLEALAGVAPSQVRDFANRQGLSFGKLTKNAPPVPALAASTDTDADGLTDLEETSGINDPATVIDPRGHVTNPASADTDGDGTSDGVEARLNTNPLDGGDYFQPLILRTASGEPTLTWPSATGTSFTVERSNEGVENKTQGCVRSSVMTSPTRWNGNVKCARTARCRAGIPCSWT